MDNHNTNWNHGFVQEDIENIEAVSVVLQNTEKKLKDLKTFIKNTERNVHRGKKPTRVKKRHKNSTPIVIPRVNKNFLLLRHVQGERTILQFREKCPRWLVMLAEGYSAIDESLFEIREELKQLCLKFVKQKDMYTKIHGERSKHLQLFTEDMKKIDEEMEKEKSTVGEFIKTLSGQIEERKTKLNENKEKRDKLRCTIDGIKAEIETLADKFWAADASIEYESEFKRGFKSKLEESQQKKMEGEEFHDKVRGELEIALRELEQVRCVANIDRFRLSENIGNLENAYKKELENEKEMKECIERKEEAQEYFSELKIVKNEEEDKINEVLSEKQSELEEEIKKLKKEREELEEVLSEKKRHQEDYLSVNELLCVKVCTYQLQITLKANKVEKLNSNIHSEKEKLIGPLKQEIKKYDAVVNSLTDKRRMAQFQLDSLYERLSELDMVNSFLRHSEIKLKYFSNEESEDSPEILPQDIMILLEYFVEQWNHSTEEYIFATDQLDDYREHVWSLQEQILALRAENDTYWCELQSLKRKVEKAAFRYISSAQLGVYGDVPKVPGSAALPSQGPLRGRAPPLAIADTPVIKKMTHPPFVQFGAKGTIANDQIYANFGKFLFL